jgi:hypothetical protein
VYSQSGLTGARVQPKDKGERERFRSGERERYTALKDILRFIRFESSEPKRTLYRPPQFKIVSIVATRLTYDSFLTDAADLL